jgi:hypothetical protein
MSSQNRKAYGNHTIQAIWPVILSRSNKKKIDAQYSIKKILKKNKHIKFLKNNNYKPKKYINLPG